MRLIDADALDDVVMRLNAEENRGITRSEYKLIDSVLFEFPTIEAQPERKTGKWIKITTGAMRDKYMCSVCGRTIEEDGIESLIPIRYPFCHCGTKMETSK